MNKLYSIFISLLVLSLVACEPIEDRDSLSNSFNPEDIELEVIQTSPGSNGMSIRMNTPGVAGYWDIGLPDYQFTDRVDINYLFKGDLTFTYYVSTPYMPNGNPGETEYVATEVNVTVDKLDQPLPDAYYKLVGEDLGGKTWVFDGGSSSTDQGGLWWFMSPLNEPDNYMSVWWNAGGECCPPADAEGKMVFDLNGGLNYTYYATVDGDAVTGSAFKFSPDFKKLSIVGDASILGYENGAYSDEKTWEIKELTADKLVLWRDNMPYSSAWTWVFVPAE